MNIYSKNILFGSYHTSLVITAAALEVRLDNAKAQHNCYSIVMMGNGFIPQHH
jgi:hypothetical protein